MSKGVYYLITFCIGLLLLAHHHLGYSYGDSIFRLLGIPAWSQNDRTGLHFTVFTGILLFLIGIIGAKNYYRHTHPQILSRLVIGCIAFFIISPYLSEGVMFLVKYNSTGTNSIDIAKSNCNVRSEPNNVVADCSFTIYNYGKIERIAMKPIFPKDFAGDIEFEKNTFSFGKHCETTFSSIPFNGILKSGSNISGSVRDVDYDIEVNVLRKDLE